jgi:hypothetical protein
MMIRSLFWLPQPADFVAKIGRNGSSGPAVR